MKKMDHFNNELTHYEDVAGVKATMICRLLHRWNGRTGITRSVVVRIGSLLKFIKAVSLAVALMFSTLVHAEAPDLLSYQGVLTLDNGMVVTDGTYSITFRVHATPAGGVALYSKMLSVGVRNGLYNVILSEPDAGIPLTEIFTGGTNFYMEVELTGGPGDDGIIYPLVFAPRQQIASVPYAMAAGNAGVTGAVQLGDSSAECSLTLEGTLRYSFASKQVEVCNGTDWLAIQATAPLPPVSVVFPMDNEVALWTPDGSTLFDEPVLFQEGVGALRIVSDGAGSVAAAQRLLPGGPYDLSSGATLKVWIRAGQAPVDPATSATDWIRVVLGTGSVFSQDLRGWNYGTSDGLAVSQWFEVTIDPASASNIENGTYDPSSVNYVMIQGIQKQNSGLQFYVDDVRISNAP